MINDFCMRPAPYLRYGQGFKRYVYFAGNRRRPEFTKSIGKTINIDLE